MTDTDRIAQMAREAHDAGAKAGGWVRQWEHMAPSQRKEWEAVALAVARLVAEDCAKVCDESAAPHPGEVHTDAQWCALHLSVTIRARYK